MSSLLTTVPALHELQSPHLLVVGAWRHDVIRVLLHRQELHRQEHCQELRLRARPEQQAGTVCLRSGDPRDYPGARTVDAAQLDLLGALGGTADSLANLRALILPLAQEQGLAVTATLEGILRAHLDAAPALLPGSTALRLCFPPTMPLETAASLLDDMVQHAAWSGHPVPRVRSAGSHRPFAGDAREARIALEGGRVAVSDLVVLLPVREPSDWRPYAAHDVRPQLAPGHQAAAIELEVEALAQRPQYRGGDAEAIRALARHRVEQRLWQLAWERAREVEAPPGPVSSRTVVEGLCEHPQTAGFGRLLHEQLTGTRAVPAWWDGGRWLVGARPRQGLRNALLIEAIAEQAADITQIGRAKLLVVDGDLLAGQPPACAALERLLRAGRKHHGFVIVHCEQVSPELLRIADLTASWLVDRTDTTLLSSHPAIHPATHPDPAHERPLGWWLHSRSRQPQALGCWFTTEEVVAGGRLLSGVTHA